MVARKGPHTSQFKLGGKCAKTKAALSKKQGSRSSHTTKTGRSDE